MLDLRSTLASGPEVRQTLGLGDRVIPDGEPSWELGLDVGCQAFVYLGGGVLKGKLPKYKHCASILSLSPSPFPPTPNPGCSFGS